MTTATMLPVQSPVSMSLSAGEGQRPSGTHVPRALARLIAEIKETHRLREDMHRAEKALTLRIGAQRCRLLCGNLKKGDKHQCGRAGRYGLRPGGLSQAGCVTPYEVAQPSGPGGKGHGVDGSHKDYALPTTADERDRPLPATRGEHVPLSEPDAEDHAEVDNHQTDVLPSDLALIVAQPLIEARAVIKAHRLKYERTMAKLAKELPVWPWVADVRGFGALGLAQIVGECGDLSLYANPAKVWKRMGLAVIDGGRQRKVTGDAAFEHGYSPSRRSIVWNIGDGLIKQNQEGEYRTCYLERKAYEVERQPEMAPIHAHNRAKRYMEKRLLKHLWQAWRRTRVDV